MPMRKKAAETSDQVEFLGLPDDKKLIIQMHKETWEQLRKLSFELNISMAELCRKGIARILKEYKEKASTQSN